MESVQMNDTKLSREHCIEISDMWSRTAADLLNDGLWEGAERALGWAQYWLDEARNAKPTLYWCRV